MARKAAVLAREDVLPPAEIREDIEDLDEGAVEADGVADDEADGGLDSDAAISDNIGEQSIEINVESLIAELEAESSHGGPPDLQCARRKLEDYLERKRIAQELEDFEDFVVEE